jgi:hypothetical protein
MSEEMNKLIPELPLWNNGDGIDIEGWVSCMGNYEFAVAYGEFFWPRFVEHDGCIFRGEAHEKTYRDWIDHTRGDKTGVESVMNHVHIMDIFPNVETPPSKEQIIFIGKKLKEMWEAKLTRDFPDRTITVSFSEEDSDDLLDYVVTFYQERDTED